MANFIWSLVVWTGLTALEVSLIWYKHIGDLCTVWFPGPSVQVAPDFQFSWSLVQVTGSLASLVRFAKIRTFDFAPGLFMITFCSDQATGYRSRFNSREQIA